MKLLVVISVIACSYAAQLDRSYLPPPGASAAGGSPGSLTGPRGGLSEQGFGPSAAPDLNQPTGTVGTFGQPAAQYGPPSGASGSISSPFGFGAAQTGKSNSLGSYQYQPERARAALDRNAETLRYDNRIEGDTYTYSFETSNGITADESGIATNGVRAQGGYAYTADDGQVYRITYTADENGYQPQGDHLPTSPPIPEEILRSLEENARAAAAGIQEGAYNPNEDSLQSNQQYPGSSGYSRDQGYQYDTPSAGISRSDTGAIDINFANQQGGYQAPGSQYNAPTSSGSLNSKTGYQSQITPQQYNTPNAGRPNSFAINKGTFGPTQSSTASLRPNNQYISPASSPGYSPTGSPQSTVQIVSKQQYNTPSASPTAARPKPTISSSSPSDPTAGPTGPNTYTSSSPTKSSFALSDTAPSGFAPSGPTASGPSPSASAPLGSLPSSSGFVPSSSTAASARPNAPSSAGVQISEYSKAGQVNTPQSDDGYNYNRPQPGFSDSRTAQTPNGSQRPSGSNQGFIINVPGSTESGSPTQTPYQPKQPSSSRSSMTGSSTGYEYDRPGTRSGASGTAGANNDRRVGQTFGGPRQPPSFSQDEGYKY